MNVLFDYRTRARTEIDDKRLLYVPHFVIFSYTNLHKCILFLKAIQNTIFNVVNFLNTSAFIHKNLGYCCLALKNQGVLCEVSDFKIMRKKL